MKQWTREIEVSAPIDHVWSYLNGSLEQMQKIMPQVVENEPIKITEGFVGSIYRQKYKEGKRIEEYDVHTLEYLDTVSEKKLKINFTLAKMFEITAMYELYQVNDKTTKLIYTVANKPLKWFVKPFLLFSTDKVVVDFLERVKSTAESEL